MKRAIAIVVGLSAVLLVVAADIYNEKTVKSIVVKHLMDEVIHCGKLAGDYLELSKAKDTTDAVKTKLALASWLIQSVGSIRYADIIMAADKLEGRDYAKELGMFKLEVYKIDSQVDEKLQALVKLADEIPNSTIMTDVREVIDGFNAFRGSISDLGLQKPPKPHWIH